MPKRPDSHKLEDKSRNKLRSIIPSNWIFRDIVPDYGLDALIEIFDESSDQGTGLQFYTQIKAKEKIEKDYVTLWFPIDHIAYYNNIKLPLLIAVYEAITDAFYYRWFWEYDPYYGGKGTKTKSFRILKSNYWNGSTPNFIYESLKMYFEVKLRRIRKPIKIYFNIANEYIKTHFPFLIIQKELEELSEEYNQFFVFTNKKEVDTFDLLVSDDYFLFTILMLPGIYVHGDFKGYKSKDQAKFLSDLIIFLAFGLAYYDIINPNSFISIIEKYAPHSTLIKDIRFLELIFGVIINYYDSKTFLSIMILLIDLNIPDDFLTICYLKGKQTKNFEFFKGAKSEEIIFLEKWIMKIEKSEIPKIGLGSLFYNLGSVYRTKDERGNFYNLKKAKKNYFLAAQYDPSYKKRFYFYNELGGIYFFDERYISASKLYKKALELNDEMTQACYADTLYYSKKFSDSLDNFEKYLSKTDKPKYEWILKHFLIKEILRLYQLNIDEMMEMIDEDFYDDKKWLNMGFELHEQKAFRGALICYLIAGFNNFNNLTAFINAIFLCFFQLEFKELGFYIIQFAYRNNRTDFFRALADTFPKEKNKAELETFLKLIDNVIDKKESEKDIEKDEGITIRLIDDEGNFKEL